MGPKSAPQTNNAKTPKRTTTTSAKAQATPTTTTAPVEPDIHATLKELIVKLDSYLAENIKLRELNEALTKNTETLTKRIETLEQLLSEKNAKEASSTSIDTPSLPVSSPPAEKTPYHALILSDSMLRHVGGDCPKVTRGSPKKTLETIPGYPRHTRRSSKISPTSRQNPIRNFW